MEGVTEVGAIDEEEEDEEDGEVEEVPLLEPLCVVPVVLLA